jgi:hypothetical protein
VTSAPFDDDPGSLGGETLYYIVEYEGPVEIHLSLHPDWTANAIRLGFDDGDPLSAEADPHRSAVDSGQLEESAGAAIEVVVVPLSSTDVALGTGLKVGVDAAALAPATLRGAVVDRGNGAYTFTVLPSPEGDGEVRVVVEGEELATTVPVPAATP